jgi:hypothetical protein
MPFVKGEVSNPRGKLPGTLNKNNQELRDMILMALSNVGGVSYLERQAEANPVAFLGLVGKVLPTTITGDPKRPIGFKFTIELVKANHGMDVIDAEPAERDHTEVHGGGGDGLLIPPAVDSEPV